MERAPPCSLALSREVAVGLQPVVEPSLLALVSPRTEDSQLLRPDPAAGLVRASSVLP